MMEQLGQMSNPVNTARRALAGSGTQTAALAFGGRRMLVHHLMAYRSNRRI
jgi:hypothetical protein